MNRIYNIICYRIKNSVKPIEVFKTIEELLGKFSLHSEELLFLIKDSIFEFSQDGEIFTSKKNAVNEVLKHHPLLEPYYKADRIDKEGEVGDTFCISNFLRADYSCSGKIDCNIIKDIVEKVPKPYNVSELKIIFNSVNFSGDGIFKKIDKQNSPFGEQVGDYISYERSDYGNEKNSFIYFSAHSGAIEKMRKLFFEFAELIPGKYEGTEQIS